LFKVNEQVENAVLPNKSLSNFEIEDAVKKIGLKNFCGVFLRDTLPKKAKKNECGIMNLDNSSGNGTHWVAWFKSGDKKWYFDLLGLPRPTQVNNFLDGDVFYPTEQIPPRLGVFCGHLCLYVLKQLQNGKHLQDIINNLWWYIKHASR